MFGDSSSSSNRLWDTRHSRIEHRKRGNVTTDERDTVLRIVDTYERLLIENSVRKAVMKSLAPRPGEPALEQQVATLIVDMGVDSDIHQHFEELRETIRRIAADHPLIELL